MNRYKLGIIFACLGILFSSFLMILSTYAYFSVEVEGESTDMSLVAFNDNTDVVFKDTSNVSIINFYTGEEITKSFSVTNTSKYTIYYDIKLDNVVNNFAHPSDLVYELDSNNNGAYRNQSIMPTEDEIIASFIRIEPGVTQEYNMKILFLDTQKDQSDNMNKTFSSKIKLLPSKNINVGEDIYKENTLLEKIISNSKGSASNINFDNEVIENGIYYTNSSINGITTYFYRGNIFLNNNVLLNNICYKILRTTENNNIRLVYNGEYSNGVCGSPILEELTSFNTKSNYNAYVGYMYGDVNSNSYNTEHNNKSSSKIKNLVEKWYELNIKPNTDFVDNSIYCNNRKTSEFSLKGVLYSESGFGSNNTGYQSANNKYYSYYCYNKNDRLSKNNEDGVNVLNDSVGLLTLDELIYSGFVMDSKNNTSSFLYTEDNFWTMSPAYFNGSNAYSFSVSNGKINKNIVSDELGIRPVITISKDTKIQSGNGSINNPYIIN